MCLSLSALNASTVLHLALFGTKLFQHLFAEVQQTCVAAIAAVKQRKQIEKYCDNILQQARATFCEMQTA